MLIISPVTRSLLRISLVKQSNKFLCEADGRRAVRKQTLVIQNYLLGTAYSRMQEVMWSEDLTQTT